MRVILLAVVPVLALAACAAQPGPKQVLTLGGDEFAYWTAIGPPSTSQSNFGATGWMAAPPGLDIVMVARNGAPLTETDRPAAIAAARAVCRDSGLLFNDRARGSFRAGGELAFSGDCQPWP